VTRLTRPEDALLDAVRRAARQEQFLEVVSDEEATRRFQQHLDLSSCKSETVSLAASLGRVLAHDIAATIDVPPFDRSNVDGFAIRTADSAGATDMTPRRLVLNREVIACGHAPQIEVLPGTATALATGGMIPRGADAVLMIEHTELLDDAQLPVIEVRDRFARDRDAGGVRDSTGRRGAAAQGRRAIDR
jgi:putative molybdopterin biosynthesis protein